MKKLKLFFRHSRDTLRENEETVKSKNGEKKNKKYKYNIKGTIKKLRIKFKN